MGFHYRCPHEVDETSRPGPETFPQEDPRGLGPSTVLVTRHRFRVGVGVGVTGSTRLLSRTEMSTGSLFRSTGPISRPRYRFVCLQRFVGSRTLRPTSRGPLVNPWSPTFTSTPTTSVSTPSGTHTGVSLNRCLSLSFDTWSRGSKTLSRKSQRQTMESRSR